MMPDGSLIVVGSGIAVGHLSAEARGWISAADKVLYCVADPASERLILRLSPRAESLYVFYGEGKRRVDTYKEMAERIMECVREGQTVCAAFYGHPAFFVDPGRESVRMARAEGYSAKMLPAVSCLDCLFCDLDIEPGKGCGIYEATDLLLRRCQVDIGCHVVILQPSAVGDMGFSFKGNTRRNFHVLKQRLLEIYPAAHEIVVYEASQFPGCEAIITRVKLEDFSADHLSGISTLYIPPVARGPVHLEALKELGLADVLDGVELVPVYD